MHPQQLVQKVSNEQLPEAAMKKARGIWGNLSNSTLQPVSLSRREKSHEILQNKQLIFYNFFPQQHLAFENHI